VDPAIRAVSVAAPPAATMQRVAELEVLAWQGDRAGVVRLLEALVPTYTGSGVERSEPTHRPAVVPLAGHAPAAADELQPRLTSTAIRSTASRGSSG
jgi:hypothetical protein